MKILIACEESQEVCKAFRALGFEAYSCDLQECSGGKPEWHIVGDALKEAYSGKYGITTYLSVYSGTNENIYLVTPTLSLYSYHIIHQSQKTH